MKRASLIIATIVVLLVSPWSVKADDPNQIYDRLYGDDAKKATPRDSAALALQLVDDSASLKDAPALAELLLTKAEGFYSRAVAGEDKTKAGEALIERFIAIGDAQVVEGRASEACKTYQRALKTASTNKSPRLDDIQAKIRAVQSRMNTDKKLADLLARIKNKPDDAATAKALVLLYVLDLDQPAKAAAYLEATGDEAIKTYVPLAAKQASALEEQVLKGMGAWYEGQAAKAGPVGKAVAYGRARLYYELFMEKHTKQDADFLAAKKALSSIEKAIDKLSDLALAMAREVRQITLDCGSGVPMKLALIPAGKFLMGSPDLKPGYQANESPQYTVMISKAFYMGVYEVTQAQYEAVMGMNPSQFRAPNNPVNRVSWDDAAEFCRRLSERTKKTVRLPTEAQWEYACRAGTTTAYCFGDDPSKLRDFAWFADNSDKKTHPVGQKAPNPAGLYDMYGNVCEWCGDWYAEKYDTNAKVDPQGPASGKERVLRGGSWNCPPAACRSASRISGKPDDAGDDSRGLRVVVAANAD